MDKNGKIGGRINIIDILAVIMVAVAAFGISLRFISTPAKNAKQTVKVSFVVEIEGIRKYSVDALSKKGNVIDAKRGYFIGEIKDFSYTPQELKRIDSDGKMVSAEMPDRYNAEITIEADCNETDSGFYIGDNLELSVGTTVEIATKYANSSGKVKSFKKLQ